MCSSYFPYNLLYKEMFKVWLDLNVKSILTLAKHLSLGQVRGNCKGYIYMTTFFLYRRGNNFWDTLIRLFKKIDRGNFWEKSDFYTKRKKIHGFLWFFSFKIRGFFLHKDTKFNQYFLIKKNNKKMQNLDQKCDEKSLWEWSRKALGRI